jgi:uncharacterized cofD-like protein
MALPSAASQPQWQRPAVFSPPPRIAAFGGGTGLPNVLRGLCAMLYPGARRGNGLPGDRLVAIVTTSDDGGSSGRLRREFGMIAPGDIRNCLAALAEDQSVLTELFQFRFAAGDGLHGHALGNLMLTALHEVTGDFARAVEIAARVVGARGRVLPATTEQVTLRAELVDGRTVVGETAIVQSGAAIRRLSLLPPEPRCLGAAIEAVRRADVIVAGPGSLYSSILPPLLMPEMLAAIRAAHAPRIFVLNLMTEPGETEGFDAARHLEVVRRHLGVQPFEYVILNTAPVPPALAERYAASGSQPITVTDDDLAALRDAGVQPCGAPLAAEGPVGRIRHHPGRLAAAISACADSSHRAGAWLEQGKN